MPLRLEMLESTNVKLSTLIPSLMNCLRLLPSLFSVSHLNNFQISSTVLIVLKMNWFPTFYIILTLSPPANTIEPASAVIKTVGEALTLTCSMDKDTTYSTTVMAWALGETDVSTFTLFIAILCPNLVILKKLQKCYNFLKSPDLH